jgi:formylglycine-generating enzyme required for sulfatase activity
VQRALAVGLALGAVVVTVEIAVLRSGAGGAHCGPGFVPAGKRCLVVSRGAAPSCPRPLVSTAAGCEPPEVAVTLPAASLTIGPSDWEAEGRVVSRTVSVPSFRIDAFEVTVGRWRDWKGGGGSPSRWDSARAASGMTRDESRAFCLARHGDLPTEDQWISAAASAANPPRRYPWGDTGAVCRRAAWGLEAGPCGWGGGGPDTVGAHPDGDSPRGVHDLAGNVAEWVLAPPAPAETHSATSAAVARGGSWASSIATDLRVWARLELPAGAADPRVGFRCAYPL